MERRRRPPLGSWSAAVAMLSVVTVLVVATQAVARQRDSGAEVAQGPPAEATAAPAESESPPTSTAAPLNVADIVVSEAPEPDRGHNCTFTVAPTGDRYTCWTEDLSVWLGSLSGGDERLLLQERSYVFWAYDGDHLLLSPMSDPVTSAQPQPVFLYDIGTGERTRLGETVRGWLIRSTTTGYVSYPAEGGIEIVNPILGTRALVGLDLPTPVPPTPPPTEPALEETAWPEFLRATGTPPAMDSPLPTPEPTAQTVWDAYPDFQYYHEVSNDGTKVAVMALRNYSVSLWLIDVTTGERRLVTESVLDWGNHPFAFSPDSSSLAYAEFAGNGWEPARLLVLDVSSGETREVWRNEAGGRWDALQWPTAQLIFFEDRTGMGNEGDFYLVSASGGEPRLLWSGGTAGTFSDGGHRLVRYPPYPERKGVVLELLY